jgi:pre-60S factor REI1
MTDKGHCKILHEGEAMFEFTDFYDYSSSYPDGTEVSADEAYQPEMLQFNDNMQLVLPSGVTLGHRALKIYYR